MRKTACLLILVATFSVTISVPTQAVVRQSQAIQSMVGFSWNPSFKIRDSVISFTIGVPMSLSASGLPNKVLSGESHSISIGVGPISGAYFKLGEKSYSLDRILSTLGNKIEKIDLKPIEDLVLDKVAILAGLAMGPVLGPAASTSVRLAGKTVIENTDLWLMNELEVEGRTSGPSSVSGTLRTWFGRSGTMTFQVAYVAERGLQAAVSFMSRWVMRLHFDLKQSLYSHSILGPIVSKIAEALHLPWEPVLGMSGGSSTPTFSCRILVPDFDVRMMSSTQAVVQGERTSCQIRLSSLDEFDSPVALSIRGLPSGVTASFSATQLTPTADTILSIQTGASALTGSHTLTVTAEGGGKTHEVTVQLSIVQRPQPMTTDSLTVTRTPGSEGSPPLAPTAAASPILMLIAIGLIVTFVGLLVRRGTSKLENSKAESYDSSV